MNALTKDLLKMTMLVQKTENINGKYRQKFHIMPVTGWLNDPNGLCWFNGKYHVFYQYSPFQVDGGLKMWGHCSSSDLIEWTQEEPAILPDQPYDCHGAYSGTAFIEDGKMYLYYTGNVKEEGDYDYITEGRRSSTISAESCDGKHFGNKKEIMDNEDYPKFVTRHVRDPKVWKENGRYYMLLGARSNADEGMALVFVSEDRGDWKYSHSIQTKGCSGYMWECPDYIQFGERTILSACVQEKKSENGKDVYRDNNGFFYIDGDITEKCSLSEYHTWDYGFDYYAPQSLVSEDGRIIQIAWMGMPGSPGYVNLTIEEGWQHCLTFPREIFLKDGKVLQQPVRELGSYLELEERKENVLDVHGPAAGVISVDCISDNDFRAALAEELILEYKNGMFSMFFTDCSKKAASGGRTRKSIEMECLRSVKIIKDSSSAEVFLNDGEAVFSTRYYPKNERIQVWTEGEIYLYRVRI